MDYKHQCIKCSTEYETNDVEPYLCSVCNEERLKIAKEIDSKMMNRERKEVKSQYQLYEELRKQNGGKYPSTKQIGI